VPPLLHHSVHPEKIVIPSGAGSFAKRMILRSRGTCCWPESPRPLHAITHCRAAPKNSIERGKRNPAQCLPARSKPIRPLNRFAKSKDPSRARERHNPRKASPSRRHLHRTGTDWDGREARPGRARVLLVPLTRQIHTRASAPEDALRAPGTH